MNRQLKLIEKYSNKIFGNLKILDISHKEQNRTFFNAQCLRCNNFRTIRTDRINHNLQSCSNCSNSLQKEIADKKYLKLRKYKKVYNSYKGNAKNKNIEFYLTLENIIELVDSSCYYCGDENSNGIDKVNAKEGYYMRNCVPCCRTCNFMKNNFTIYEFFEKIDAIYNKHLNK